ncbi:5-formyltetrahydrofolate cyclo-ligase [Kordiimonas lipolytica]|uniref:5-formyltetrahydrofolate cyclo-ligase n=1 Tax=Kordiimonas lipolytica TaxID=1662421 RepID=A0ABV8UEQ2_9PROT|nr:5-formyltetrahydrofolate cyclo-ligase [Kordiimonas lipolytica]
MTISQDKSTMRENAKRIRMGAHQMYALEAAEKAATHGMGLFSSFEKHAIIGAYWPMGDELDPRFLMSALERAGYRTALPVVTGKDQPLTFRLWGVGDPLEAGSFGTQHPCTDAPEVVPNALIVPLLAYDEDCYRLGWGGGFYDRTLAAHTEIKAFGFAFGAQIVDHVPREAHDWPLQGVITEEGVILPRKMSV